MKKQNAVVTIFIAALIGLFSTSAFAVAPANDNFANAEVVSGMQAHVSRTNVDATRETGEGFHVNNFGGKSVWFKWTAPTSRRMMITLTRSDFNTLLAVYTGNAVNNLTLVAQNDDIIVGSVTNYRSYVSFKPTAGQTYYIAVDGYSNIINPGAASGNIMFDLAPVLTRSSSDFDADGITDISVFRRETGVWWVKRSSDGGIVTRHWGNSDDAVVAADFSAVQDSKTDFAVFRANAGIWYFMNNLQFDASQLSYFQFGQLGDIVVSGDFIGDERTDVGAYRLATGEFFYSSLAGEFGIQQFGQIGGMPVVGDYDSDDRTDLAVYRNGTWYVNRSTGGYLEVRWGNSSDIPMRGDYDGDGIFDFTVFRPSTGEWWTLRSSDGQTQVQHWGISTDFPVRGDFDGDGKFDYAVFRGSEGIWYILQSSNNQFRAERFGIANDQPAIPLF